MTLRTVMRQWWNLKDDFGRGFAYFMGTVAALLLCVMAIGAFAGVLQIISGACK